MCIAQGHNAVPPVRLEPVAPSISKSTLDTTMSPRSLANSNHGGFYQSVHRALNLLSSKPARKILHRYRIFYMRSHLKCD